VDSDILLRLRRCEKKLDVLLAHHGVTVDADNPPEKSVPLKSTEAPKARPWWSRKSKLRAQAYGEVVS
jgi:hypothetical protein